MAKVDPIKFYNIAPRQDDPVDVDPEWIKKTYNARACAKCHSLLAAWRNMAIDLPLLNVPKEMLPCPIPMMIDIEIWRADLFETLRGQLDGYAIGQVLDHGLPIAGYVSAIAGTDARIPRHGDDRSYVSSCPGCGRRCEIPYGDAWVRAGEVHDRAVWSSIGGGLYVRTEIVDAWPAAIRQQLKPQMDVIEAR